MTMTYIRFEETVRRQDVFGVGRALIVLQLVALAVIGASGNLDEIPDRAAMLALGIAIVLLGLWQARRSRFWGRVLVGIGGFPLLAFFGWLTPFLAVLLGVVYVIIFFVSLVA